MSDFNADAQIKEIVLEAVVIRADGTVEDLGVISRTQPDQNAVKRLLKQLIKRDN